MSVPNGVWRAQRQQQRDASAKTYASELDDAHRLQFGQLVVFGLVSQQAARL